jgi:hypothetical protein
MDQTLLKFVHSHWPPNNSQLQQGNISFNSRQLLANDTPQQRTIYNFYRLNTPLKFPQTLAQNELLVNCSLNHSLDWTLTQFPQLLTLTYHFLLNLSTSTSWRVQDLQAGFLFTSTPAHHHTSATQPPDMLHTSSAKSRVQNLAKKSTHHTRESEGHT